LPLRRERNGRAGKVGKRAACIDPDEFGDLGIEIGDAGAQLQPVDRRRVQFQFRAPDARLRNIGEDGKWTENGIQISAEQLLVAILIPEGRTVEADAPVGKLRLETGFIVEQ
jgi:hypothetical protein